MGEAAEQELLDAESDDRPRETHEAECPECNSENIYYCRTNARFEEWTCRDCGEEFQCRLQPGYE